MSDEPVVSEWVLRELAIRAHVDPSDIVREIRAARDLCPHARSAAGARARRILLALLEADEREREARN